LYKINNNKIGNILF